MFHYNLIKITFSEKYGFLIVLITILVRIFVVSIAWNYGIFIVELKKTFPKYFELGIFVLYSCLLWILKNTLFHLRMDCWSCSRHWLFNCSTIFNFDQKNWHSFIIYDWFIIMHWITIFFKVCLIKSYS
jgi:hypothetical protein